MVLGMDIASTPVADLEACGHLVRFLEATPLAELAPHDELARGDTEYVLAAPGRAWVAWSGRRTGAMGVAGLPPGVVALTWLDCATGVTIRQSRVPVPGGEATWRAPEGMGGGGALRRRLGEGAQPEPTPTHPPRALTFLLCCPDIITLPRHTDALTADKARSITYTFTCIEDRHERAGFSAQRCPASICRTV